MTPQLQIPLESEHLLACVNPKPDLCLGFNFVGMRRGIAIDYLSISESLVSAALRAKSHGICGFRL